MVAELVGAGLRGRGGAVAGGDGDDDDQDGDEDGGEAGPGQPGDLLELADGRRGADDAGREEGPPVGAGGVGGEGVEAGGDADDAGAGAEDVAVRGGGRALVGGVFVGGCGVGVLGGGMDSRDDEEEAGEFFPDDAADVLGHVGDGVAVGVLVAEVALDDGRVGV